MEAAIVIDAWKISISERHLTQSGYAFTKHQVTKHMARAHGLPKGALVLSVEAENMVALALLVRAANDEAAKTGAAAS